MPGTQGQNLVEPLSYTPTGENGETTSKDLQSSEKEKNATSNGTLGMATGNNALLIFDFDQTITNQPMHNFFVSKEYSDYNSDEGNAVTEQEVKEFLQKENSGIKNEERLKSILKSALSSGVEVAIASFTKYIKAVEYVVKNHLGLTEEQAQSIKVVGSTAERKDLQIGKNLRVLYLLKAYKKTKGVLPQKVMLVDDNKQNINPVNDFRENLKELLEKDKDMESILKNIDQKIAEVDISEGELENITFKGINVSSEQITETDRAAGNDYLNEVEKWIKEPIHQNPQNVLGLNGYRTLPPPYKSKCGSEKSPFSESRFDTNSNATLKSKKTNRIWPKVKYAMQQKGFIIFSASAIILGISTVSVYLQDKEKFIAFVTNSPNYITIPVIALASLLAISAIFYTVKRFSNTKEHQIQRKNADGILDEVLKHQQEDKVIKSVRLEYSNNTHSNFIFNAWESKNDFINIDEKVISRTNKIKSVINNRPLFTVLLTGVVAANIALPLGLLTTHGVNGVQKFYQNPLTNNIGLLLLISSGVLALLVVCLGVHYYNKTNCTNLIYSQEKIYPKKVNGELIEEIKRERTNVLGENHSKDAKCSSLTLEQVVVQSYDYPDAVYSVD